MTADLIVRGGDVVTMDARRRVVGDGGVAVADGEIIAVDSFPGLRARYPAATVIGDADALVTPGYVNAHQHLTGDRLVRSCIPDDVDSRTSIFEWAVPVHSMHTGDDDELTATLGAAEALLNGVTTTVEAGTVAHPDRVADALARVGMRARIGTWGWDVDDVPYAAPADEVLTRQRDVLDRHPPGGLIEGGVTLVGHDLMSDELLVGAAELAVERGVGMTMHISPDAGDPTSYLARTGVRPLLHFDRLGVLGPHLLLAHAVHLDGAEIEVAAGTRTGIASCPWAYLRLAQGFVGTHRHDWFYANGGRLALGADAENAGDAIDLLRVAALFVGLVRDRAEDPASLTADDGFALATIDGAAAIGLDDLIGSIEVGKRADLVVHDRRELPFVPIATDPVRQLVWASDGRTVRDVVVDGRHVVRDRRCVSIDLGQLRREASERQAAVFEQLGLSPGGRRSRSAERMRRDPSVEGW